MSKLSDTVKELRQFADALNHCIRDGNLTDLQLGITIAVRFVNHTAEILSEFRRPLAVIGVLAAGGRYDPYKDLRPVAQEFIDKWSRI